MTLPLTADEAAAPGARLPDTAPRHWLAGERLRLREFCAEDLADLMRMHADRRLRAHLLDDQPLDKTLTAVQFLVHISRVYRRREGLGIWHASLRADDGGDAGDVPRAGGADANDAAGDSGRTSRTRPTSRFIGWFNLMPLPARGEDAVELGSRLLPDAWGGALALEGGELLLDHGFDRLALPRVWATCDPDNRSARACLAALGFHEEGLDDYDGRTGLYAAIERSHWAAWRRLPRRERLRAARGLRLGAPAHPEAA